MVTGENSPPARRAGLPCAAALAGCSLLTKHYSLRGRVLAKSTSDVTVNAENIPGFMPAMTMPYPVRDLEALRKGPAGRRHHRPIWWSRAKRTGSTTS